MSRKDFVFQTDVDVLDDILLDEGNARIRAANGQLDCIDRVLRKREQMQKLMKSIAEEGLSTVPILLTRSVSMPGKWVVKDGNRRITALKLLNDPTLCVDKGMRTYINGIVKTFKSNIPRKIDCLSSDSKEAIAREVVLRHSGALGGVGQLDWSAYLRTVYLLNNELAAEHKRSGQYLLWAESHGIVVDDEFPITTVTRFFSAENIGNLGFEIQNDNLTLIISEKIAIEMAERIIGDLSSGRKTVNSLYTTDAATKYISEVRVEAGLKPIPTGTETPSSPQPSTGLETPSVGSPPASGTASAGPSLSPPTRPTGVGSAPAAASTTTVIAPVKGGGRPPSKPTWDRKKLFWSGAPQPSLPSSETKMRGIYYEIAQIKDVMQSPLTTAFLIRALIELSEKHYRTKNGLIDKNKLADNIASACDSMLAKGKLTVSQVHLVKSYTVTKAPDVGIFNVDTLQKYLHRETHLPTAQTINTFWDELHVFIHACWK